jgi:hypothetical protein
MGLDGIAERGEVRSVARKKQLHSRRKRISRGAQTPRRYFAAAGSPSAVEAQPGYHPGDRRFRLSPR